MHCYHMLLIGESGMVMEGHDNEQILCLITIQILNTHPVGLIEIYELAYKHGK